MASDGELEAALDRIKPGWREEVTVLPPGQPEDPEPFTGWCEYLVDATADWYHPTWCHVADHHEWIHAELRRRERDLRDAYETLRTASVERRLLAAYRSLLQETDMRSWCEDHDAAGDLWRRIDVLEDDLRGE